MTWELSLSGLVIGILVGLTGMGGGSLLTPLLVLVFGFKPAVAIGTDILHGAIFKTVGAVRHRSLGNVQGRLSGWMLLGSAPMSLAGVAVAHWLKGRFGDGVDSVQGQVLGAALVFGGFGLVLKTIIHRRQAIRDPFVLERRDRLAAVAIGLVGGFIVGLTSVGSGTFFALTLLIAFSLRSVKVVGTDIFHAAGLLWVAGLGHLMIGNVDMGAVGWLLVGSLPGVLVGSQVTARIPDRALRVALAALLVASGTQLIEVPAGPLVALLAAAASLAAVVVLGLNRRSAQAAARALDVKRPAVGGSLDAVD